MKVDRALKIKRQQAEQVRSAFRCAEQYKWTSVHLYEELKRINERQPKDTPRWVQEFVLGYKTCLYDQMMGKLVFCYVYNAKVFTIYRNHIFYYGNYGLTPKEMNDKHTCSGLFWNGELLEHPFSLDFNNEL